ncbi:hypothetical protein PSTH1771_23390 [Pseudomonas syringae pv. theae]|uniref:hypothetical protein n=1 Tax=Pseudomonas syringae TaxID=317 RepID=UPI0023D052FF|nr:hypothetical protein [Pseudomonas syringae]GKS08016.1 hypothetical protein PSTH1771_23390 [Pseudomonas syringae pv. theae]
MSLWDVLVEATIDSIHVFSIEKEIRLNVTSPWEGKKRYQIIAKGVDDFSLNGMRGRRQKLSATPDQSGTVNLCHIMNSALKNASRSSLASSRA